MLAGAGIGFDFIVGIIRSTQNFGLTPPIGLTLDVGRGTHISTHRHRRWSSLCSACGSTHTESGRLYRKVKHRSPPKSYLTPTAKARPIRRRSRRSQGRGAPHTEHGLGVLGLTLNPRARVNLGGLTRLTPGSPIGRSRRRQRVNPSID